MSNTENFTNELIHETSPYLLQHAHNPVNWMSWGDKALEKAKKGNKPLLISIGYAACHWCHVMEGECFEDIEVAEVMNHHFVNIKIDREQRPDIDQIYMDAIQMMKGQGGWPLNMIALPDGRPFWGTTYMPKEQWIDTLVKLANLYKTEKTKVEDYAQKLKEGLNAMNQILIPEGDQKITSEEISDLVKKWSSQFDPNMGGSKGAPKFMMPVQLDFLMYHSFTNQDLEIRRHVELTLQKMALGGIFDHVGGGFSRYSVDARWHVPHFEKMLYDNALLVSLYSQAYAWTNNEHYRSVVEKTIDFVLEELGHKNGGFFASLDADSKDDNGDLVEGEFYVWTQEELETVLGDDLQVFKPYFNIGTLAHWEEGKQVLYQSESHDRLSNKLGYPPGILSAIIDDCLTKLKKVRGERPKPRLDDKILTSWNGMMISGLLDAHRYLNKGGYLELALKAVNFLGQHLTNTDGSFKRDFKNGRSSVQGFLDDHAQMANAYIKLYEATFDEVWLEKAEKLTETIFEKFYDKESSLFFYSSKEHTHLIRRTLEVYDNVEPSSNAMMGLVLLKLSKVYPEKGYKKLVEEMLQAIWSQANSYPQMFPSWLRLAMQLKGPYYEIVFSGSEAEAFAKQMRQEYLPAHMLMFAKTTSQLKVLQGKNGGDQSKIYICQDGSCQLPVDTVEEALKQIVPK